MYLEIKDLTEVFIMNKIIYIADNIVFAVGFIGILYHGTMLLVKLV